MKTDVKITTRQPWAQRAACRDNPEPWTGDNVTRETRDWAKKVCLTECPVFDLCQQASETETWHVWAGEDKNHVTHGHTVDGMAISFRRDNGKWYVDGPVKPRHISLDEAAAFAYEGTYILGLPGGASLQERIRQLRLDNA